jgi:hypothetical protein
MVPLEIISLHYLTLHVIIYISNITAAGATPNLVSLCSIVSVDGDNGVMIDGCSFDGGSTTASAVQPHFQWYYLAYANKNKVNLIA